MLKAECIKAVELAQKKPSTITSFLPLDELLFNAGQVFRGTITSPDGIWKFNITMTECDSKGNVNVLVNGSTSSSSERIRYDDIKKEFYLTPFSFPLTDNTVLADGNRFAFILDGVRTDQNLKIRSVALSLIWFPKSYFTARERPINYAEFRSKLGLRPN